MDFGLSEDQLLLDKTVRSFLSDQVPIERVRELREKDCPNDRSIWSALAELGVTGVLVPELQGGSELALLCVVHAELLETRRGALDLRGGLGLGGLRWRRRRGDRGRQRFVDAQLARRKPVHDRLPVAQARRQTEEKYR